MTQLRGIAGALRPGGHYICITPNRHTGPHDISAAFADEAEGFHLHEYTYPELRTAFQAAGLRKPRVIERAQGRSLAHLARRLRAVSPAGARALERWGQHAATLPWSHTFSSSDSRPHGRARPPRFRALRRLLGINIIAQR